MIKKIFKTGVRKFFWGFLHPFLTDKQYAKIRYWLELDTFPDLKNPTRFTEKIQYIKLNEQTALRKTFANRTKARQYVSEKIGDRHLIPLIGVYDELTPAVWQMLPDQFVLKANHGSGMIKIVSDKNTEDYNQIYQQTEQWKDFDYAAFGREWAYKGLSRSILAEELVLDSSQSIPKDYKFFCFEGNVKLIQIDFDRFSNQKRNLYTRDFEPINATFIYPNYKGNVQKPKNINRAIDIAETLSLDVNFLRVDLYLLKEHIYFGELTNYPENGFAAFEPEAMERKMGSYLRL